MELLKDKDTWYVVSFIAFILLLYKVKFFHKISNALDKRGENIADELNEAKKLREEAETLRDQLKERLQKAEKEAERIVHQAEINAEQMIENSKVELTEYAERKKKSIEARIKQAEQSLFEEVKNITLDKALSLVEQNLKDSFTKTKQKSSAIDSIANLDKTIH